MCHLCGGGGGRSGNDDDSNGGVWILDFLSLVCVYVYGTCLYFNLIEMTKQRKT